MDEQVRANVTDPEVADFVRKLSGFRRELSPAEIVFFDRLIARAGHTGQLEEDVQGFDDLGAKINEALDVLGGLLTGRRTSSYVLDYHALAVDRSTVAYDLSTVDE